MHIWVALLATLVTIHASSDVARAAMAKAERRWVLIPEKCMSFGLVVATGMNALSTMLAARKTMWGSDEYAVVLAMIVGTAMGFVCEAVVSPKRHADDEGARAAPAKRAKKAVKKAKAPKKAGGKSTARKSERTYRANLRALVEKVAKSKSFGYTISKQAMGALDSQAASIVMSVADQARDAMIKDQKKKKTLDYTDIRAAVMLRFGSSSEIAKELRSFMQSDEQVGAQIKRLRTAKGNRSAIAGLKVSIGHTESLLRSNHVADRVGESAAPFLASFVEAVMAATIEDTIQVIRSEQGKRKGGSKHETTRIKSSHISEAVYGHVETAHATGKKAASVQQVGGNRLLAAVLPKGAVRVSKDARKK
ncbi:hypothetical protein JKP88DRAFT_272824 [Tribonema minus]|uniref:Histone H2B n=1 Tax=Tribonema minus TaxID=303371 RepID=A0A835Z4A8_9STRA|nr:hypothetical protein JKP88DRAFT_272824 [Tribonema minus]